MNLSLKNRVAISFVLANVVIVVLGLMVFHYLDGLNKSIEKIMVEANRITLLTDEIRISAVSILKYQRKLSGGRIQVDTAERMIAVCENFLAQLQTLETLPQNNDIRQVISKMIVYVDAMQVLLKKSIALAPAATSSLDLATATGGGTQVKSGTLSSVLTVTSIASVGELADKILESFSEFQDLQYFQSGERNQQIKKIIRKTKRNMMYTLIITFVGTMLLGLVIPGKIALPFKKISDAIRELQSCNFDVSIYYDRDDEIGEMAKEINKMIVNLKQFEELRAERILIEGRKFDTLANMVKKHILIANAKAELIYLNNNLYSLLQLQSDDIINKVMRDTRIPVAIIECYELAIKRRSKMDNIEIAIHQEKHPDGMDDAVANKGEQLIFSGYANIIPIRGKESSLDYYLMILSEELIV
ncbi:MAG: HAMP domain-containing protein [Oligoflexia bacterium]|nr:HAMP domain-containing protein [Oligoflexia bacterium]MBF0367311.1 HAMP domain-containing protein [Oligoflexia bacterium]